MERQFTCIWCKHTYKESEITNMTHALFLGEYPNTCVCEDCFLEWTDNLLYNYTSLCEEVQKYAEQPTQEKLENILYQIKENENEIR